MVLLQSIEHVSIVYTCNTYLAMCLSMYFIRECLVNVRVYRNVYSDLLDLN